MKIIVFLSLFILHSGILFGQIGLNSVRGAKSHGLGQNGVSFTGIDAIFHNPAGIIFTENYAVNLSSEQRFLVDDLNASAIAFVKSLDNLGAVGVTLSNFGIDEFKQQELSLQYARKLAKNVAIGVSFDYLNVTIDGYGNKGIFNFGLGLFTTLSNDLDLAVSINNPLSNSLIDDSDLGTEFRLGLGYHITQELHLYAELSKSIEFSEVLHFGIDYQLFKSFSVRIGSSTQPAQYHFGMAYRMSENIWLEGGFSNHPNLGTTPALSLTFSK